MSVTIHATDGPIEISDLSIEAVRRRADFVAEFTAHVIRQILGRFPASDGEPDQFRFPAGFLLDVGAIGVLTMWEQQGITAHLEAGLPTRNEATAELFRRVQENPQQFDAPQTSLSSRVLQFWVEHFAWDGVEQFGADILLDAAEEDAMIDAAASFLWENRHALLQIFEAEEKQP